MRAATRPVQRPAAARLLVVADEGTLRHAPRTHLPEVLEPGDLMVANDAATLPASLPGRHAATDEPIEVRLAGRASLDPSDVDFTAVVFGAGDHRIRTEDRPLPPPLRPGDRLRLGPLRATVTRNLGHPRLVRLTFAGPPAAVWAAIADHGRPIQYSHVPEPLALWDVWTRVAGPPVAFEPPSAGFLLDWRMLDRLADRGIAFATLTHAAGISSTGDPALDARLPFDEAFRVPPSTVREIARTRERGGRVIALGTTVVRALENAATADGLPRPGAGLATGRIGPTTTLRVVDAVVSGVHEAGESHYELLRAFAGDPVLGQMSRALEREGYRSHEFGDSVLVHRNRAGRPRELHRRTAAPPPPAADARRPAPASP